jgi:hypothetical protein
MEPMYYIGLDVHKRKISYGWSKGTSRDFSQCHGHIIAKWADLISAKREELQPDKVAIRSWLNEKLETVILRPSHR